MVTHVVSLTGRCQLRFTRDVPQHSLCGDGTFPRESYTPTIIAQQQIHSKQYMYNIKNG